jgi:hypothetical protein
LRGRSETKALVDWLTKEFRKPGMTGDEPAPIKLMRKVSMSK